MLAVLKAPLGNGMLVVIGPLLSYGFFFFKIMESAITISYYISPYKYCYSKDLSNFSAKKP